VEPGVCCQFVNKGLTPTSYIFDLILEFGSGDRQDVLIYGCMCIDIFILVYLLYNLIFSVPVKKGSDI
jgi:hypothetical protein